MADKSTRYQPLELDRLEQDIEDLENERTSVPEYIPPANDYRHAPTVRGRSLRRMLLASVAFNALLIMLAAWQYLKLRSLSMACDAEGKSDARSP